MTDKVKERIKKELEKKTGRLNLNSCKLDRIPEEVGKMVWLTTLYFSGNQISKLEGLEGLSSLTRLYLNSNQISKLEGLEGLSSLTRLYLNSNQISKLEGLEGLSSLTRFDLSGNQISKLEGLEGLSSLTRLYLNSNQISKLEGLEGLSNLTEFYLGNNQISKLEGLEGLSSLTRFDLSGNQISKLEGLEGLSNLTEFYLGNNQISKLEGLEGLSSLTRFDLSGNQISKLEGLEGLSNLTEFYLGNNQISKLEGLEGLSSLTRFDLSGNQISKLEGLEGLSSLTRLYLNSNQISKLEGLEGLSSLTTLDLSGNQISKLEGLEGLSSLTELYLYENQLSKLEGLEGLSSLIEVYFYGNQISKLEGLEGLSNLTTLDLSSNQISKLEGLEGLSNLTTLYFRENQISQIEGLLDLFNLKILDFENNPLKEFPIEYQDFLNSLPFLDLKGSKIEDLSFFYPSIKKGRRLLWENIEPLNGETSNKKKYFQFTITKKIYHVKRGINVKDCNELDAGLIAAIQNGQDALLAYVKEPKERLFEARVLVLGEPRAGKTTLRRKLLDVGKAMPTAQQSTKAFEIEVTPFECEIELKEQKEKLRYHLWDFGGQDYYRLLHQLFVTEQSVYIIVVDTDRNKNEEEIAFWLDTIERLGKDDGQHYGPVILFQNPKNKRPGGTFTDLKRRYPFWQQTEDFFINLNALNEKETSSFDNGELVKFRGFEKYLSRSFCQLDHVGKEIPIKWIAVREALLEEKENWISVERFNAICTQKEIKEKRQRTDLLNIFRQLGYLLHYKNTALKGMVILNREWVTDALYRVLDDPIVEANKGWFAKEDAEKI